MSEVVFAIVVLTNVFLGLFALLNNPKNATNKLFFYQISVMVGFTVVNAVSLDPVLLSQITWIRLDAVFGAFLFLLTYLVFRVFPAAKMPKLSRNDKLAVWATVFISVLSMTPLIFSKIEMVNSIAQPRPGPAIPLLLLHHITLMVMALRELRNTYKIGNIHQKEQLRLIAVGVVTALSTIIIFNFIAVQVFSITWLVPYSLLGVLVFATSFTYAVVRHGFLTFRLLVAKSIAYTLVVLTLLGTYSLVIILLASYFFDAGEISLTIQIIYGALAVISAATFQPLKQFFDKISNKIFFQDSYDTEELFDKLNDILISSLDMQVLTEETRELIEKQLKLEFLVIDLGISESRHTNKLTHELARELSNENNKVLEVDSLDLSEKLLKEQLRKKSIAVVSKLKNQDGEVIGLLIFGDKKSGNAFTMRDLQIIDILSDEVALALQNSLRYEEIKQFSNTLEKQIESATKELRLKNEKLRELDQAKDDFISMASHQLRTPLTTIKGYLSMLQEGDFGILRDKQQNVIDLAYTSSERMVYLIADLLNVSRINTGKFVIERNKVDFKELIKGEIKQLQRTATAKNIKLKSHIPKEFPDIYIDETKMRQVIMNLIDNAIYYTPNKGTIDVHLVLHKDSFEFKVVDTGIGVPKKDQANLFAKFFRATNARNARPDGTGLGLYMAQKVVSSQGGTMLFKSTEDRGSTFGFRFSLAAVNASKKPKKPATK